MGFIEKILAFVMLPLAILIILEYSEVYSLALPFDKVFIGAILMLALQIINLTFGKAQGSLTPIHMITAAVFILPALAYLMSSFITLPESIPLILAVLMLAESVYALH